MRGDNPDTDTTPRATPPAGAGQFKNVTLMGARAGVGAVALAGVAVAHGTTCAEQTAAPQRIRAAAGTHNVIGWGLMGVHGEGCGGGVRLGDAGQKGFRRDPERCAVPL